MANEIIKIELRESTGAKYRNNRMLNYHRYGDHPSIRKAIQALCDEMGYKGMLAERQSKVLALDLYHCFKGDKTRYLTFFLSPNSYESVRKYNWFKVSYRPVRQITERLFDLGYIEVKKGFRDKKTHYTESSKMRANGSLIELLEKQGVKPRMISTWKDEEIIILKDKKKDVKVGDRWVKIKPKIDYEDTDEIIAMRNIVTDYNALLAETHADIDVTGYEYVRKIKESDKGNKNKHLPLKIDLSNKKVKRVFNDGDFEHGGRFYNGFWQQCPESLRQHIMLDGEHVYEYDFSGLHVHLLYSLVGLKLGNKEPYILPKCDEHNKLRRVYKLLMLTSVNCKNDHECIAAVTDELEDEMLQDPDKYPEEIPDLETMLKDLKKHHKPIKQFINKSTGLALQCIDSGIAEVVIEQMTSRSIPVLCVHDSFVCKESDAATVHKAMKQAFIQVVSQNVGDKYKNLNLQLDDIFTTECKESQQRFPSYRRLQSTLNLLTWAFSFKNQYAKRRLKHIATRQATINHVVTITPRIEYY